MNSSIFNFFSLSSFKSLLSLSPCMSPGTRHGNGHLDDQKHNNNKTITLDLPLPPEVLMQCFQHMDATHARSIARVCTIFKHLIYNDNFKKYCQQRSAEKVIFLAFQLTSSYKQKFNEIIHISTIRVYRNNFTESLEANYLYDNIYDINSTEIVTHNPERSHLLGDLRLQNQMTSSPSSIYNMPANTYTISQALREQLTAEEIEAMESQLKEIIELSIANTENFLSTE